MSEQTVTEPTQESVPASEPTQTQEAPETTTPTETQPNGKAEDITASEAEPKDTPATWPDDWRARLAGKDQDAMKRLNRFQSPEGVYKSWRSLEQRLSAGELKSALPQEASDEQIAEWRKENGIPEAPDKYELPQVSGYEWTDDDKPMLDGFLHAAHEANFDQGQVNRALNWYVQQQQSLVEKQFETDTQSRQALEEDLRTEWGPEFRANLGLMKRYLADVPDDGGDTLLSARLDDGSRLIDQPWFAKWVAELAKDRYGDISFISGEGAEAISSRKKEIENIMREDPNRYFREGLDKELLELTRKEQKANRAA